MRLDFTDISNRMSRIQDHLADGRHRRVEADFILFSLDT